MTDEKLTKAIELKQSIDSFQRRIDKLEEVSKMRFPIASIEIGDCSIIINKEDAIVFLTQELLNLRAAQEKLIKQFKRL